MTSFSGRGPLPMTQLKNCAQIALSSSFKVCVSPFGKVYASARNSDALMIRGEVMPYARKSLSPVNKTSAPALIAALRTGRSFMSRINRSEAFSFSGMGTSHKFAIALDRKSYINESLLLNFL